MRLKKNPIVVYFSLDHQWESDVKVVIVFKEKAGFKELISLVSCGWESASFLSPYLPLEADNTSSLFFLPGRVAMDFLEVIHHIFIVTY